MNARKIILLTNDRELEIVARSAASACCDLVVGRSPQDAARLFARSFDDLCGVVVDLDSCQHGTAWLTAFTSLARKIPGLAISRLNPQFLRPLACRYGVEKWLSKPATKESLTAAFQVICGGGSEEDAVPEGPSRVEEAQDSEVLSRRFALSDGMKPREFSIYFGTGERCVLKEDGVDGGRRFDDLSQGMDYIVRLDWPQPSMVTVYGPAGAVFRIAV